MLVIIILMRPTAKSLLNKSELEEAPSLIDDIEQSLIKGDQLKQYCGIDDFEKLFEKKRLIGEAIGEYQGKNKTSKQAIEKARQRLFQIELLADKAEKQSVLLRNQIEKINEAHTMTKILTIERMIKAKMEHDELQKRKETIFRIREEKHRASMANRSRKDYYTHQIRQLSLLESRNMKQHLNEHQYNTIEVKRSRAEKVREDKARLRDRLKRYQEFKAQQAKKNYLQKVGQLREALEEREKKLEDLYKEEVKEEHNFQTTENVTKQYLGSLFPTETI